MCVCVREWECTNVWESMGVREWITTWFVSKKNLFMKAVCVLTQEVRQGTYTNMFPRGVKGIQQVLSDVASNPVLLLLTPWTVSSSKFLLRLSSPIACYRSSHRCASSCWTRQQTIVLGDTLWPKVIQLSARVQNGVILFVLFKISVLTRLRRKRSFGRIRINKEIWRYRRNHTSNYLNQFGVHLDIFKTLWQLCFFWNNLLVFITGLLILRHLF